MTPVFEVKLVPKDPHASIVYIIVRIDDPVNIYDTDKLMDFLEGQFPMYELQHVIAGVKGVRGDNSDPYIR